MGVEARSALGRQDRDTGGGLHLAVQGGALRRQHTARGLSRVEGKSSATFARMAGVDWKGHAGRCCYVERQDASTGSDAPWTEVAVPEGRLAFRDVQPKDVLSGLSGVSAARRALRRWPSLIFRS